MTGWGGGGGGRTIMRSPLTESGTCPFFLVAEIGLPAYDVMVSQRILAELLNKHGHRSHHYISTEYTIVNEDPRCSQDRMRK